VTQQPVSSRRKFYIPAGAVEEAYAEQLLKLVNACANSGLRDVEAFGRPAKMAESGDLKKGPQEVQVHKYYLSK
jgi:hypothetical protein